MIISNYMIFIRKRGQILYNCLEESIENDRSERSRRLRRARLYDNNFHKFLTK